MRKKRPSPISEKRPSSRVLEARGSTPVEMTPQGRDEFYFQGMDEAFKRWPDEMWAAKGKPRLWVKLYDRDGVQIWRDIAYGHLKLKTPRGIQEGKDEVSASGIRAVFRKGVLEIFFVHEQPGSAPSPETERLWKEDTLDLEVKEESPPHSH